MKTFPTIAALSLAALPVAAPSQSAPAPTSAPAEARIAVVVAIRTPPGVDAARLKAEFEKAAPRYQQIPGLIRKYFTIGSSSFGGIYYWSSKAAADAWFNDAWRARVKATYGTPGEVTYYDVPLAIDGARP